MTRVPTLHGALTIAGSDSGGGAGIQADLKTFTALGTHGTCVITCLTAQNPRGVLGIQPTSPRMVRLQLEAVFAELPPNAAKTGMLYSRAIIEVVAEFLTARPGLPVVVDPVMVATSGAVLLQPSAIAAVRRWLLPRATLVTPNLDEARLLTGMTIEEPEDMRQAARSLHETYGCAALIKGGHMKGREAVDVLHDGREEYLLSAPRVMGVSSHGTGCTYSAAITAHLARGATLSEAVCRAKDTITRALTSSRKVGKHSILGPWPA